MLVFRVKSQICSLTLKCSQDLVPGHPPASSGKAPSPSALGFSSSAPHPRPHPPPHLPAHPPPSPRLWGSPSCGPERRHRLRNNVRNLTPSASVRENISEHPQGGVAATETGMTTARLIESHVFTEAQRIPFRNGNWACTCQRARQDGRTRGTKHQYVPGRARDTDAINKVINMHRKRKSCQEADKRGLFF